MTQCKMCDYKTATKGSLKGHLRSKHEELKLQCNMCEFKSAQASHLWSHKNSAHVNKRYFCNHCDYTNVNSWQLKQHVRRKHSPGGIIFTCDKCEYETYARNNLNAKSAQEK